MTFTIDAYPGTTFQGEVGKVRLNATMTQNVVTYTVEINTDNSDGKLIPYLTANVKFMVAERKDVLLVPNAALRWVPQPDQIDQASRQQPKKDKGGKKSKGEDSSGAKEAKAEPVRGTVWVPTGRHVRPLRLRLGLSDGSMTEVQGAGLQEGIQVVLAEQPKEAGGPTSSGSPFTPQLFKGAKQ